jgi:hypothetical protein
MPRNATSENGAGRPVGDWLIGGLVLVAGVLVALVNPPAGGNIVLLGLICLAASLLLTHHFSSLMFTALFVGYAGCWLVTVVMF